MGVLTRSRTLSLQRLQKNSVEFLQLGSKKFKKVSGDGKKRQRRGGSSNLSKGKGKSDTGRTRNAAEVEKGGVKLEDGLGDKRREKAGMVKLDGGIDLVGGAPPAVGGDDAVDDVGGEAANGGGDDGACGGVVGDEICGGDGGEGAELGGDVINGDNVLVTGGNNRVTGESTHEHPIIISEDIRTICSSPKDAKAVVDEWPQTELGRNLHQHPNLSTDFLLQENNNYAPSMEKYNFDFENEKPLPGAFEWEKVHP